MAEFVKLEDKKTGMIIYVNPANVASVCPIDDDVTQVNFNVEVSLEINIPCDKVIERLEETYEVLFFRRAYQVGLADKFE